MNSESGQRLSMEELKRRNAPQTMQPQIFPTREEWQELLQQLDNLKRHTEAHTAMLREVSQRQEPCPIQAQMEALAREVAEIRAMLRQAGKQNARRRSRCRMRLPRLWLPHLEGPTWFVLVMTLAALLLLWWAWAGSWSSFSLLQP